MTATLFPSGFGEIEVRFGAVRPAHSVYVRRRLLVAMLLVAFIALVVVGVRIVLADHGGVPASTSVIRPASSPAAAGVASAVPAAMPVVAQSTAGAALTYIVQPGDTLWSLARRFHGGKNLSGYVDSLVYANGGATVRSGQVLRLP